VRIAAEASGGAVGIPIESGEHRPRLERLHADGRPCALPASELPEQRKTPPLCALGHGCPLSPGSPAVMRPETTVQPLPLLCGGRLPRRCGSA
jgi:hypothetical protein